MSNPIVQRSISFFKIVALLVLVGFAGYIIWKQFTTPNNNNNDEINFDIGEGANKITVPKEMQINYVPADFKTKVSPEEIMKVMSNPEKYRKDFDKVVYQINMDLLNHVATRMSLSDTLRQTVENQYKEHHNYLKELYYSDVIKLKDGGDARYQKWYQNDATASVEVLEEVASKYVCFLVNHVMTSILKSQRGALYVKGSKVYSPCSVAMEEGLKPMVARLEERATIQDFRNSEDIMYERMERVIGELATMEIEDVKAINKELATKIWGYKVSSTHLNIKAVSLLKVGFKLDEFFEVTTDFNRKKVVLTLPEPRILSHEVYPKIDKLDVGWMREIKNENLNSIFNVLRREFRRDAMESDVFRKSKIEVEKLMENILLPMVQSIDSKYEIEIRYRGNTSPQNFDPDLKIRD